MNPFDLRGPEFLVFYVGLMVLCMLAVGWARRLSEPGGLPVRQLEDPYLIAHLRAGGAEAVRVATVSLLDRGLLVVESDMLRAPDATAAAAVRRPLEKVILGAAASPVSVDALFAQRDVGLATAQMEAVLESQGLLADEATKRSRRKLVLGLLALLIGVGLIKLIVALSRGKANVGFLIALMIVATLVLLAWPNPRRTPRGQAVLDGLRSLLSDLRSRAATLVPGGATAELALLAGVFGLMAVPPSLSSNSRRLFRKSIAARVPRDDGSARWNQNAATACSSSCSTPTWSTSTSSCGSSSDSGSSCGGGGCGGCGGGGD